MRAGAAHCSGSATGSALFVEADVCRGANRLLGCFRSLRMPDTIFFDFLHPARVPIDAGPEGLLAVRLMEWARVAGLRGLIHVARSVAGNDRTRTLTGIVTSGSGRRSGGQFTCTRRRGIK